MIDAAYCQTFAAYNTWMNRKLYAAAAQLSDAQRKADRGAFFRSIHATLNHLLFGDRVWLPRLPGLAQGRAYPTAPMGVDLYDDFDALRSARAALDADITAWAAALHDEQLRGDLTWFSGVARREMTHPVALCVMQMFNHQTHHRGQVTTLLKQYDIDPGPTDLPWMPLARSADGRLMLAEETPTRA